MALSAHASGPVALIRQWEVQIVVSSLCQALENNSACSFVGLLLMLTDTHVVNTNQTDTQQLKLVPSQQTTALFLDDQKL
ncbi:Thymidylate synthase [Trichinella pseudospiralis]